MLGKKIYLTLGVALLLIAGQACSSKVDTTPTDQFGFEVGADYQLITYSQMIDHAAKPEVAYDHKASMLQDVEARRLTEIDYLNGGIARFGRFDNDVGVAAQAFVN